MEKVIAVYPDKCTGCRICELICSFKKEGVFNPRKSRIRIVKMEEHGIDLPIVCQHCEKAPCKDVCPTGAITKETNGAVVINQLACIGCRACATVCPYGAISFDVENRTFLKCDLCDGDPQCIKWCPVEAIKYTRTDLFELSRKKMAAQKIVEGFRKGKVLIEG